jgi:CxxC motif-containing protein (DUF1111 family)
LTGVSLGMALAAAAMATGDAPMPWRTDLSAAERQRVWAVTRPATAFAAAEAFEALPGGAATSKASVNRDSFSHPSANLSFEDEQRFKVGNGIFKKLWVSAPSSTQASDGLGPLYNARACQRCHLKDGRGHPPEGAEDDAVSLLLRLSVPARSAAERQALADGSLASIPDPTYGGQLQDFAAPGLRAEGRVVVQYQDDEIALAGGQTSRLRRPHFSIADPGYGPMDPDLRISARVAQPMIGVGLLEAIHDGDILALADPDDADGDGISGRPNRVRDPTTGDLVLGRFGWKAAQPSVRAQSAAAFAGDIGISTSLAPAPWGDCTAAEAACRDAPHGADGDDYEAPDLILDLVAFYAANLAVPARRNPGDAGVLAGKRLFYEAGCTACHAPKFATRRDAGQPGHAFQLIWPYSDLLLHDMGPDLADGHTEGEAEGSEWRTAPLWGIGLTRTVSGHTRFLHDGRARSLLEAILWHGGEAAPARDRVADMTPEDRQRLIAFLESL